MALNITIERLLTEDIFSLVGLEGLSDDEKNQLLDDMQRTVVARVYSLVLAGLSDQDRAAFEALPPEQIEDYLSERGISLATLIAEESVRYRVELATLLEQVVAAEAHPAAA